MTRRDVLVAISFRRRPKALRNLLAEARNLGVPVILISDVSVSHSAKQADIVFRCHCRNPSLSDSYTSVCSLLNFLVSATAFSLGAKARERLERIDEFHSRIDDLVVPTKRVPVKMFIAQYESLIRPTGKGLRKTTLSERKPAANATRKRAT